MPTYPSPNSTTVNWKQVRVNVELGEGWVCSCPDTDIDPFTFINWVKLEFLRLTIHSEEASNSSIECHLSKEWLLLWCNYEKNTLILFSGCFKFMWTQHTAYIQATRMTWERSVVHVVVVSHCLSLPRSDKVCKSEWGGRGEGESWKFSLHKLCHKFCHW